MVNQERYGELKLYFGLCYSDGIREGRFDPNSMNRSVQEYNGRALAIVQRYINPWSDWGVNIGGFRPLVQNEQEAQFLIEHAKQNIPGAKGSLRLVDSMHGRIRFDRSIIIEGAISDRSDEIIKAMRESGFQPKDKVREHEIEVLKAFYLDDELANGMLEEKLAKLDCGLDSIWKANLRFNP